MKFIKGIFSKKPIYKVDDVFTASTSLTNYIPRIDVEDKFRQYLNNKGKQIIIYGQSGGGKTTLIEHIKTTDQLSILESLCLKSTSVYNLILDAFDQLDVYFTNEKTDSETKKAYDKFKSDFKIVGNELGEETGQSKSLKSRRAADIQLTAQRLSTFLGKAGLVWLIDDFHKIEESEKEEFSQMLKVFATQSKNYPKLKIICVGAQRTAREVINYDKEMDGRVSELKVPLLEKDEIEKIIVNGFDLLNVDLDKKTKDIIVKFSNRLATVTHNLCNQLCYDLSITETSKSRVKLENIEFEKTIKNYISTKEDTYKKSLDKAISQKRKMKYNNGLLILKALVDLDEGQFTYAEILSSIKTNESEYPAGNLTLYLKSLCGPERDEILVYDEDSNKYSFKDPFMFGFAKMYFADLNFNVDKLDLGKFREYFKKRMEDKKLEQFAKGITIRFS